MVELTDPIEWTDDKVMPFGKHRGYLLKDVPADYLLWVYEQAWCASEWVGLYLYIRRHEDQLMSEKADEDG